MMNRRLLALSCALVVLLVGVSIILQRGGEERDDGDHPAGGTHKPLSALTRGTGEKPEPVPVGPERPPPPEPIEVNLRTLVTGQTMLPVTPEQVEETLDRDGRTVEGLIAAQVILGDHAYLREAAESHPDDPRIQFWVLANNVFPEERAQWLAKFKETEPDNALANLFAAQEAFRSMDYEAGIEELHAALEKDYRDHSDDLQQEVNTFYQSTNLFDAEMASYGSARAISTQHVEQLQSLSERVLERYRQLQSEGDETGATELVDLGMAMLQTVGEHRGADAISSRTMMLFMQEKFQRAAGDPDGSLAAVVAERERVGQLGAQVSAIFAQQDLLDDQQFEGYAQRLHEQGEVSAAEWLVEQVGEIPAPDGLE